MDDLIQHIIDSTKNLEEKAARLEAEGDPIGAELVELEIEQKRTSLAQAWGNFLKPASAIIDGMTPSGAKREEPREIKKWKYVTITNCNNFSLEDINDRLEKAFSNEKFGEWAACIEHIKTNRHIHAVGRFTRESKWKPYDFRNYLQQKKLFPPPFDISKHDSRGGNHLESKNTRQIKGCIDYVKKTEDDKEIIDFLSPSFT